MGSLEGQCERDLGLLVWIVAPATIAQPLGGRFRQGSSSVDVHTLLKSSV